MNVKLKKSIALIAKLRHYVPEKITQMVYSAHVVSHINYVLNVWSKGSRKHLIKISKNQRTALCISKFIKDHTMSKDVFKHCKELPFEKLRDVSLYKIMWKISHEIAPRSIYNLLDENGFLQCPRTKEIYIAIQKHRIGKKTIFVTKV